MGKVGILLGATEALATLRLGLILVAGRLAVLEAATGALSLVQGDALGLGLLVGGGLGVRLGLDLGSLALLLALYLGVLGGIPRVEDLMAMSTRC